MPKLSVSKQFIVHLVLGVLVILCASVCIAADAPTREQLIDPLYVLSAIIVFLYGLSNWSLGRNIKSLDDDIRDLKDQIRRLDSDSRTQCGKIAKLQGEHEIMCKRRKDDV